MKPITISKGSLLTGIKVFNNLPQRVQNLSNDTKQFKLALKNYLHVYSLHSVDEYFNVNTDYCKINVTYILS
jgi:hypothetical protein